MCNQNEDECKNERVRDDWVLYSSAAMFGGGSVVWELYSVAMIVGHFLLPDVGSNFVSSIDMTPVEKVNKQNIKII